MKKIDFLIVGAGLFGSVFAYEANKKGKKCLVIDQRNHIGGNIYSENVNGIEVHKYGAHIFHTNNKETWSYINQFGEFAHFINQPIAVVNGEIYNLPFNMNTFSKVFKAIWPQDVIEIIRKEKAVYYTANPKNLEEQAINLVGKTIYELFIKNYTEKQWGKKCTDLPAETIRRLPVRFTYDNNYFDDKYQGIPKNGYTSLIKNMLKGIEVKLNTKYPISVKAKKIIYTGMIDEFFDYKYGELEYRSLKFVETEKNTPNYQGNAVVNYPTKDVEYIRSIEHKHFVKTDTPNTIVSYEFSVEYKKGMIAFYPITNKKNQKLYGKYNKLSKKYPDIYFSGRLGKFKYFDMDDTIEHALELKEQLL